MLKYHIMQATSKACVTILLCTRERLVHMNYSFCINAVSTLMDFAKLVSQESTVVVFLS